MKTWPIWLTALIASALFCAYAALMISSNWPIYDLTLEQAAQLGDSFGIINAFFTGAAFLLILWTIIIQQKQLNLQQKEMSRMVSSQQRALHMDMLNYAIHDEDLAQIWGDENEDHKSLRKHMYINIALSYWESMLIEEIISKKEMELVAEKIMKDSKFFRDFWRKFGNARLEHGRIAPEHLQFYEVVNAAYAAAIGHEDK